MLSTLVPKVILGVSVATGVGFGGIMLLSHGSNKVEKADVKSHRLEIRPETKKGCALYKIHSASTGQVEKINDETIKKELGEGQGHYQEIKDACDKSDGGNIFLSRKDKKAWRYYPEEQSNSKIEEYLRSHP